MVGEREREREAAQHAVGERPRKSKERARETRAMEGGNTRLDFFSSTFTYDAIERRAKIQRMGECGS